MGSTLLNNMRIFKKNSEMISQVDMEEEKLILKNLKRKEFMGENQNENMLEIQINTSQNGSITNKSYKMIVDAKNISNNDDFSIEDDSNEDNVSDRSEERFFENNHSDYKAENYLNNCEIEPIAEEDGEESKYMPTPQKPITSKLDNMKAVECIKALKAKELEKRLDLEEVPENKTFKSADAQKPKATLKENKSSNMKNLPPKVPNRSSTSNENPKNEIVPGSYFRTSQKQIPSTTKASTVSDTPKSAAGTVIGAKAKPIKPVANDAKPSGEGEKPSVDSCRALVLYGTPTVSSMQKKQDVYKPDEVLPPWGIQSINSKNILSKRVTSATTRSTVTPRCKNLKRGKSSNSSKLAIQQDGVNKTHGHIQKDIKIRKNKASRSRQRKKTDTK